MNIRDNLRIAWRAIRTNKLRALLTMLGVIIGVASVIALVAIGDGAQAAVEAQVASLGTNLLQVQAVPPRIAGVAQARGASANLTTDDADALVSLPGVAAVAPELSRGFQVTYARQNTNVQVVGTTEAYSQIRDAPVAGGRFIAPDDVVNGSLVAVLGATVATDLFDTQDPLGQTIQINTTTNTTTTTSTGKNSGPVVTPINFQVVGVLQSKGISGFDSPDNNIYVPLPTARWRLVGSPFLRWIDVEASSTAQMTSAASEMTSVLNQLHNIKDPSLSPYQVRNQSDILSTATGVTQTFTLLLAAIAAISLLVGGIGIMNIMMVSVTERTREIGIRKALGATRGLVLQQFLMEAITLSLLGGLIGVASGVGVAETLTAVAGWPTRVSPKAVLLAFSFALLMGLIFGVYPAWRAARLDPIDALRYE